MSAYERVGTRRVHQGHVVALDVDQVRMPDGTVRERDVVHHPGAVGVVALDDAGKVLLLRQYRHPVGDYLLELPAGILDVPGEPGSRAAARELAEEADLQAGRWHVLADAWATPGGSDEAYRVYLAQELSAAPDTGFEMVDEEADLEKHWVDLDDAAEQVLDGRITNALCVIGVLAAQKARGEGWSRLRPGDAPWPARPDHSG